MTMRQIRGEPHAIAAYFNDGYGKTTFNDSLELNKEYMKVAKDVTFDMEKKYGLFDTDRDYGVKLSNKIRSEYRIVPNFEDREYIEWTENIFNECAKICKQSKDKVIPYIFTGFDLFCRECNLAITCDFINNYTTDMHKILTNDILKTTLPRFLSRSFINVW